MRKGETMLGVPVQVLSVLPVTLPPFKRSSRSNFRHPRSLIAASVSDGGTPTTYVGHGDSLVN